jgi:hypothetical protein
MHCLCVFLKNKGIGHTKNNLKNQNKAKLKLKVGKTESTIKAKIEHYVEQRSRVKPLIVDGRRFESRQSYIQFEL